MIWLFLLNGLLAFTLGYVSRSPSVWLDDGEFLYEQEELRIRVDGKEYGVVAK